MTRTDISYGIIPLRKQDTNWQVLLINQYSKIGINTYWVFPKGHPEGEEDPVACAARELFEETGLIATQILYDSTFSIEYSFQFDGEQIDKTVTFFLALVTTGDITLDPTEVQDAIWLSLTDALERIDYEDTKTMFRSVIAYLTENPKLFE